MSPSEQNGGLPASQAEAQELARLADKRFDTVRAQLALRGFEVIVLAEGFAVARWGRLLPVGTVEGLEAFAKRVGARGAAS